MAKMIRKGDLPTKICAACGRPFAWRKKWARDWEAVKYCSERCRGIDLDSAIEPPALRGAPATKQARSPRD